MSSLLKENMDSEIATNVIALPGSAGRLYTEDWPSAAIHVLMVKVPHVERVVSLFQQHNAGPVNTTVCPALWGTVVCAPLVMCPVRQSCPLDSITGKCTSNRFDRWAIHDICSASMTS